MNPAEIIATKLFGWQLGGSPGCYVKEASSVCLNNDGSVGEWFAPPSARKDQLHDWPNLADWNDIRRMEDALTEKGLLAKYHHSLWENCAPEDWQWVEYANPYAPCLNKYMPLRATAEQRVAAALKVIEGDGL